MTAIPLSPVAHVGIIPAYKVGVDAVQSSMEEVFGCRARESVQEKKGSRKVHILPPLRTPGGGKSDGGPGEGVLAGGGSDRVIETDDDADHSKRLEETGNFSQVSFEACYAFETQNPIQVPRKTNIVRENLYLFLMVHFVLRGTQVTSRTRYLMRCMERGVAPRAHIIIRKTHTTKVRYSILK